MIDKNLPHAEFLRDIQSWVWKRFPTRQLSATDVFYALQWAESGVPFCIFSDGFEAWLHTHPLEFVKSGNLSALHFEADRIIKAYHQHLSSVSNTTPTIVDDPYETALTRIAEVGKKTQNPLLRDELRIFYQNMIVSRTEARKLYPDWNQRSESFYPLKARAIIDWDASIEILLQHCFSMLSEQEQTRLQKLAPVDEIHCMQIGEDAQKIYKLRILNQKIAEYFEISVLMTSL